MTAVTSIMRAQQILLTRLNALLSPYGLTFPRYEALMILYLSRRARSPSARSARACRSTRRVSPALIDGLEKQGYVVREPHETDRRTILAAITARGREVAGLATVDLNDAHFATSPLTDAELETLTRTLLPLRADEDGF